jgi:hypothetical protein
VGSSRRQNCKISRTTRGRHCRRTLYQEEYVVYGDGFDTTRNGGRDGVGEKYAENPLACPATQGLY